MPSRQNTGMKMAPWLSAEESSAAFRLCTPRSSVVIADTASGDPGIASPGGMPGIQGGSIGVLWGHGGFHEDRALQPAQDYRLRARARCTVREEGIIIGSCTGRVGVTGVDAHRFRWSYTIH